MPVACQSRDPACSAEQVNSPHLHQIKMPPVRAVFLFAARLRRVIIRFAQMV
jgi:hypothetical protein